MPEAEIEIINKVGIHLRLTNIIAEFENKHSSCDIQITIKNDRKAAKKSTIEIIILGIIYKEKVKITFVGKKEKLAITSLLNLLKWNFSKELAK
ncbi:HPr family phosphocarrier protein [Borreliella andersonii]|uniref:HPr family phosphocarrier protein n=1 Tax=Borrelia andersonii TaxID=42109 RepID=UPI00292F251B|nr:HPr family phosphocarrier protein [Borreliella andersonii]WNY69583.1 HPr family phosphocarrier protein [Borreliella andersonii]